MSEYTKKDRQLALRAIISDQEMGDQYHLLEELKKRGMDATQATVSRDLQELGVAKVRMKSGAFKYEIIERAGSETTLNKLTVLFDNFVVGIKSTGNQMLIKTSPGNANGVASFIDRLERPEILGTVAGDDTIILVVDTPEHRIELETEFRNILKSRI